MHVNRMGGLSPSPPRTRGISPTRSSGLGLSASANSTFEGIVARLGLGSSSTSGIHTYRPGITSSPAANSPYHSSQYGIGSAISASQVPYSTSTPTSQIPPRVTSLVDPVVSPRIGLSDRLENHTHQVLKVGTMKERTERLRRETASLRQSLVYSPRSEYQNHQTGPRVPTPTRMEPSPVSVQPAATPVWASPNRETDQELAAIKERSSSEAINKLTDLVSELKRQLDKARNDVRILELSKSNQSTTPERGLNELNKTIYKQQSEINTLNEKIIELNKTSNQTTTSPSVVADLEGKLTDLQQQLTQADQSSTIAELEATILELQATQTPTAEGSNERIAELEAQLASSNNSELHAANQKISDLEGKISLLEDNQTNTSPADNSELQAANATIAELESKVASSDPSELQTANAKVTELEKKISQLEATTAADLEAANATISELESKVASADPSELQTANSKVAELEEKISQLREAGNSDLEIANKRITELESSAAGDSELQTANSKVAELEEKISQLEATAATPAADFEAANATIAELESKLASADSSELQAANDKIKELKSQLEANQSTAELEAANTRITELTSEVREGQEQLSKLAELEEISSNWKAKITELTAQIEQQGSSTTNIAEMEEQQEASILELAQLKNRFADLEEVEQNQRSEISKLKQLLEEEGRTNSVESLREQLATAEAEKGNLEKENIKSAEVYDTQVSQLQSEIARLTITPAEPQMMEMTISTLRSTISQLQDSQSSLKKQLADSEKRHTAGHKNHLHPYTNSACNESCNFSDVRYEQSVDMSSITDRSCSALSMKSIKCIPHESGPVFYLAAMIGASGGSETSPALTFCLDSAPRPGESPADHASRIQGEKPVILELPHTVHDTIRPIVNAIELHCDDPDKRVIKLSTPRSKITGLSMLHRTGIQMQEYSGPDADFVIVNSPGVSEHSEGSEHEKPLLVESSEELQSNLLEATDINNTEELGTNAAGLQMLKISSPGSKMSGLQLLENAGLHPEETSTEPKQLFSQTDDSNNSQVVKPLLLGNLPVALEEVVRSEIKDEKIEIISCDGIKMLSISSPRSRMVGLSLLQEASSVLSEDQLNSSEALLLGNLPQETTDSIRSDIQNADEVSINGIQMLRLSSPRSKMRGLSMLQTVNENSKTSTSGPLLLGNLPDNLIHEMKEEIPCAKEIEAEDGSRMLEIDSPRSKMESMTLLESAGLKTMLTDRHGIDMLLLSSPKRGRGVSILRRAADLCVVNDVKDNGNQ